MSDAVPALEYQRLTVHRPGHPRPVDDRLVADFAPMDWDRKPLPYKTYPGLATVPLARELEAGGLGRLLFLSAGVVRTMRFGGRPMLFRAAGSAGNLFPLELYLVESGGVFHYEPLAHGLTRIGEAPGHLPTMLIVTGVPWRTCWKYRERGWRHLWWDAGTMLAHVLELEPAARVHLGFVDDQVAALVGAEGPWEYPLAVVTLDSGPPVIPETGAGPVAVAAGHLADEPTEFPLVTGAFAAGALETTAAVEKWVAAATTASEAGSGHVPKRRARFDLGAPVDEIIRRRGSARSFESSALAPSDLLQHGLEWAARAVPADFTAPGATLLDHHVLVFAAEGVEPGGYRLGRGGLEILAVGDFRGAGRHLCLDQDLGGDGAFTVFHGADLAEVTSVLGDRGYRAAQLEAGVVEGRLHLAAYSRGLGATGLTFYDDVVERFFATDASPMLVTAVGKPSYRSRPGGPPGRPVVMAGR